MWNIFYSVLVSYILFLPGMCSGWMARAQELPLLPIYTLTICFLNPSLISATPSCMYCLTILFNITTGIPFLLRQSISLTYTFLANSSLFIKFTKPPQGIYFHLFHYTTLHLQSLHVTCLMHTFIALTQE